MKHNQKIANIGQNIAKNHLSKLGYSVIFENYRIQHCEIDLIAQKNQYTYLIEIKTVVVGSISPEDQLSHAKKKAMARARRLYANEQKIDLDYIYIEFIGVILDFSKRLANIKHFLSF